LDFIYNDKKITKPYSRIRIKYPYTGTLKYYRILQRSKPENDMEKNMEKTAK